MTSAPTGSSWREHLLFFGRFLRNPRSIGAIAPSSPALADVMVAPLKLGAGTRVVELGPGTGALTAALVSSVRPGTQVLAIDREPLFIERLRARWPQIDSVCASAAALQTLAGERGLLPIDHIVSGLPFASLPQDVTAGILQSIEESLRTNGTFTTFQYVHAYRMPPAIAFRRDLSKRLGSEPTRTLVMRNLPPAYVLTWKRVRRS
jgi:phosphatidylethanolamine/phosphatidyl-N-methylethanolamine N-methyltransferase